MASDLELTMKEITSTYDQEPILIVPKRRKSQRGTIVDVWRREIGGVLYLDRFWRITKLDHNNVKLYGGVVFAQTLAQALSLDLVSPCNEMILNLCPRWVKRNMAHCPLRSASRLKFPIFTKPLELKLFRALVYNSFQDFRAECYGLPDDTEILTSEAVAFESEVRFFVLDSLIRDCSFYKGSGDLGDAINFLSALIKEIDMPETYVVDIGFIQNRGWAVIEFNPVWAAGPRGCGAANVAQCIAAATKAAN